MDPLSLNQPNAKPAKQVLRHLTQDTLAQHVEKHTEKHQERFEALEKQLNALATRVETLETLQGVRKRRPWWRRLLPGLAFLLIIPQLHAQVYNYFPPGALGWGSNGQCYISTGGPPGSWGSCSGAGGSTFQVNGTDTSSQTTINFENSSATCGLTLNFSNPSAGNVQLGLSGSLTATCLSADSTTVNGQTCTLGSTCTIPEEVNSSTLTSQAGFNLENSSATDGITLTLTNTGTNVIQLGFTGTASNAFLANSSLTFNGQSVSLGSSGNVNSGATAHSIALNEGNGSAISGITIPSSGTYCIDVPGSGDPTLTTSGCPGSGGGAVSSFSGDGTLITNSSSTGAVTVTLGNTGVGYGVWGNTGSSSGAPSYNALSSYPTAAFPTLNQNTTGTAASITGSITLANTPLTTLGDILYVNSTPALARLAGNTTTNAEVLTQTGTGSISAPPAWSNSPALSAANMTSFPTLNQSTTGNAATATNLASYPTLCSGGQFSQGLSSGSNNCATPTGGGNVSTSGTITTGSLAEWASGTTIETQALTQYDVLTGGASDALNQVAPSATSGEAFISNGSSSQPGFSATLAGVTSVNGTSIPSSSTLLVSGGALGTPSSGTLTNAAGLPFSGIATGTNTAATMTCGTGCSFTFSGTGSVNASEITGLAWPSLVASDCLTNNGTTLSWGSCGSGGGVTIGNAVSGGTDNTLLYVNGSGDLENTASIPFGVLTTPVALTVSSSEFTPTLASSNQFTLTLGSGDTIANPTGSTAGQQFTLAISQPSSGGPDTVSWGSGYSWVAGSAPTLATAASAVTLVTCQVITTTPTMQCYGPVNSAFYAGSVQSPTAPSSTSAYQMQGFAGSFTPTTTGNVELEVCGTIVAAGSGTADTVGMQFQLSYGTGTAPGSNATLTGTQVGPIYQHKNGATMVVADTGTPGCWTADVTLTVGTTYWLDVAAESLGTASEMEFSNAQVKAHEFR